MPKPTKPRYENIKLVDLRRGRRGKHYDLLKKILDHLAAVPEDTAMKIPLEAAGVSVANLRSALDRATKSRNLTIGTYSEGTILYVWNRPARSSKKEDC